MMKPFQVARLILSAAVASQLVVAFPLFSGLDITFSGLLNTISNLSMLEGPSPHKADRNLFERNPDWPPSVNSVNFGGHCAEYSRSFQPFFDATYLAFLALQDDYSSLVFLRYFQPSDELPSQADLLGFRSSSNDTALRSEMMVQGKRTEACTTAGRSRPRES